MELERPIVHAPPFAEAEWLNAPSPLSMQALRGQVVLIDVWDFTCVNCLRTLPYLRGWYERYAELGLVMIGVHTPEFSFARMTAQVRSATRRLGVRWPVVLDNAQKIWMAYANRYWPTLYLVDGRGYIRYRHVGEGGYAQTERAIQSLLLELHPGLDLPEPLAPVRPEDAPGAVCYPTTPELHIDAVGNPQRPMDLPLLFSFPDVRPEGHFYLEGTWKLAEDSLSVEAEGARLALPFEAASVNAVLSPHPDPITLELGLKSPVEAAIGLDGAAPESGTLGEDVYLTPDGARLRVDSPRMYNLLRFDRLHQGELHLAGLNSGMTVYAFSFGTCIAGASELDSSGAVT